MVFIDVYDTYILFLGGIDVHNKIVVDDAYVFYENRWLKINILNYPQGLVEAKTAVCGSRVFLFGG